MESWLVDGESSTEGRWVVQQRSEAAKRIELAEAGPARGGAAHAASRSRRE